MHRLSYFLLLALFFFLMVMYDFYAAFLSFAVILLAPLPSVLLCLWARKRITVTVPASIHAVRGEEILVPVQVSAPCLSFLPGLTLACGGQVLTAENRKGNLLFFSLSACPVHCGIMPLGPIEITLTDVFGLLRFSLPKAEAALHVLPKPIGRYDAASALLSRLLLTGEPEHFGAAPYKEGDSVRLINWKVTARKDDLYVRDTWPAEGSALLLAASVPADGDARDTVGDALLTIGRVLLAEKKIFSFLWTDEARHIHHETLSSEEEWKRTLLACLTKGGATSPFPAAERELPPDLPLLFLTGETAPILPQHRPLYVWNADPSGKGDLCGRAAIAAALGGE